MVRVAVASFRVSSIKFQVSIIVLNFSASILAEFRLYMHLKGVVLYAPTQKINLNESLSCEEDAFGATARRKTTAKNLSG